MLVESLRLVSEPDVTDLLKIEQKGIHAKQIQPAIKIELQAEQVEKVIPLPTIEPKLESVEPALDEGTTAMCVDVPVQCSLMEDVIEGKKEIASAVKESTVERMDCDETSADLPTTSDGGNPPTDDKADEMASLHHSENTCQPVVSEDDVVVPATNDNCIELKESVNRFEEREENEEAKIILAATVGSIETITEADMSPAHVDADACLTTSPKRDPTDDRGTDVADPAVEQPVPDRVNEQNPAV